MIRNMLTLPLPLLKAFATPKAHGRVNGLSLWTGKSRLSVTCSAHSSQTAIDNLTLPTLKFLKSRASRSSLRLLHFCSPAVTVNKEQRFTVLLPTDNRHQSYLMLPQIWCVCVPHLASV